MKLLDLLHWVADAITIVGAIVSVVVAAGCIGIMIAIVLKGRQQ